MVEDNDAIAIIGKPLTNYGMFSFYITYLGKTGLKWWGILLIVLGSLCLIVPLCILTIILCICFCSCCVCVKSVKKEIKHAKKLKHKKEKKDKKDKKRHKHPKENEQYSQNQFPGQTNQT